MKLTITGYSTALFSTWYFIEEVGILLDCGDGVTSSLLQKSRKIDHIFISHADRDHLTGLLQMNQLNARPGFPVIYYPAHCRSFPALEQFSKNFDPHVSGTQWKHISEHSEIQIKKDLLVQPVRNSHVSAEDHISKSLGYKIIQAKRKLKPEYADLTGIEIKRLKDEFGDDHISIEVREILVAYSGDTPVENESHWDGAQILIHEATFIDDADETKVEQHGNRHSTLEGVIEMVSRINIGALILGHFSSRYDHTFIEQKIRQLCVQHKIKCPVYAVLPGNTKWDILNSEPLNSRLNNILP